MRSGGSDTSFFRLAPLDSNPLAIQLLCALIGRNGARAAAILAADPGRWLLYFLGLAQENALASLLLERIYTLGLRDLVSSLTYVQSANEVSASDGVWAGNSLATNLQRQSAIEISRYDDFDDKFVTLLDGLECMGQSVVWPKGISLSRSLYGEPFHRSSGDFDCILRQQDAAEFVRLCSSLDYALLRGDPGFCNQLEVGPTSSLAELFASPSPSMTPSAVFGLSKNGWPLIDPKFNPLDRGLACKELERFFDNAKKLQWRNRTVQVPCFVDHLLITLVHSEKDRFHGWKSLIDIDLLAQQVGRENGWTEFVRRCQAEGVTLSAWSGLYLVRDRFGTVIPNEVITELMPSQKNLSIYFTFAVEPLYYWNCSSLLTLSLNAAFTADRRNKIPALRRAFFPSRDFLALYYCNKQKLSIIEAWVCLMLHWLVLILPGLLVRKSFGQAFWRAAQQYQHIETSGDRTNTRTT